MRVALIGGRRVAYGFGGDSSGQPVLVIHGAWGGPSSTLWNGPRLRWPIASRLRLIHYDRRCAGLSGYEDANFALSDLACDAADLLDYLQIERCAVVATSAGGPIGLRLALDHPHRVSALVLLNTGAALMSPNLTAVDLSDPFVQDRLATVERRLALVDLAESAGIAAAVATSESEWRQPPAPPDPDPELDACRRRRLEALAQLPMSELVRLAAGAIRNMRAQAQVDLTAEVSAISCPALILHGDADTTVPLAYGQALASAIANAEFSILNGDGHGLIANPRAQMMIQSWLNRVL